MDQPPFRVGDKVVVRNDPDNDVFQGLTGRVEYVGVACADGIGVVMDTVEFGRILASYSMIERVN